MARPRITLEQVGDLITLALVLYAYLDENPQARARIWLRVQRGSSWAASRLGRLAMRAELAYRREVSG